MSGCRPCPGSSPPAGGSAFEAWRDRDALVVLVGKTQLRHQARAIEDPAAMVAAHAGWMALGAADEHKPAAQGTV